MQLYQLLFPNGKKYIGITSKTAQERFKTHCKVAVSKERYAVHNAINKFGKENVIITALAECDNWELLCLAEMEAIEKYDTFNKDKGYNLTMGGDGTLLYKSEEEKNLAKNINRINNKEKSRARDRCRYSNIHEKNKEYQKEYQKKYRENHKEKSSDYNKIYQENNKDRLAIYDKNRRLRLKKLSIKTPFQYEIF